MNLFDLIQGAPQGGMNIYGGGGRMNMRGMPHQQFRRKYHAYSPAYWQSENKDKLESGDKIVMPASSLEELSRMHIEFPIMFEIAHDSNILPKKSHCSVLEFTAPEGCAYLPIWMIDNLGLDPHGDSVIELTVVSLPKGQFVQFQAHETDFAMLPNPKVILEKNLRTYSCLTEGDTIQIQFANHIYKLDVTQVKPSVQRGNAPPSVSIIETDIKVDFKEPMDYKQWQIKHKQATIETKSNDDYEEETDDFGVIDAQINKSQNFKSFKTTPYSTRGLSLGKGKGTMVGNTKIGKCEYHKPQFINGKLLKQKHVKKEEEVVGIMRYIYEIDQNGNRNLIRKLPVRRININKKSNGYSLK